MFTSRKVGGPAVAMAVVTLLCASGTARAAEQGSTAATRQSCVDPKIEHPFARFGDNRDYVLAPGGAFDDAATSGWSLEDGATVTDVDDPLGIGGGESGGSLSLPPGASATSPLMCVDLTYPTMRFVLTQHDVKDSDLDVEVLYPETEKGKPEWHRTGTVKGRQKDGWKVTEDVRLDPERSGKLPGGRPVALRFTSHADHGSWQIDDVYVDPRMSR
jgi:hypothetical protein